MKKIVIIGLLVIFVLISGCTFEYSCANHPSMPHGKVVVRG